MEMERRCGGVLGQVFKAWTGIQDHIMYVHVIIIVIVITITFFQSIDLVFQVYSQDPIGMFVFLYVCVF